MLIINGTPIKNCLDFYDNFDVTEILRQPREFAVFAKNHLNFNPLNKYCIEVFERAVCRKLFNCISEMSFWQGRMSEFNVNSQIRSVVTETYAYYNICGKGNEDNDWEKKFMMAAAATILAEKNFVKPTEKMSDGNTLQLDKEDNIELTPGRTYSCKYNPDVEYDGNTELRTVEIYTKYGYTSNAVIWFGDRDKIELKSGDRIYVNVFVDTAVRILPNEVKCKDGVLKREKEYVTFKGENSGIPVDAPSFVCLGAGQYLYIKEYRLSSIGIDGNKLPRDSFGLYAPKYVEVAVKDSEYYLLSSDGIVKTRTGTPKSMNSRYISLPKVLENQKEE